ncbi:MAG: acetyl-CoA carboxylase biotin carboxyl carrier protein subunit [Acidobacteria bacterium]|nr:acetyl-CoA carboxylase biotin carboxyl carrier protein subunit [Acidobacteriota bacterium]
MSKIGVVIDGRSFEVEIDLRQRAGTEWQVLVNGEHVAVSVPEAGNLGSLEWMLIDGRPHEVVVDTNLHWLRASTGLHRLEVRDLETGVVRPASQDGRVRAPIPGAITRILAEPGTPVETGQILFILEAMKMENPIGSPKAGKFGDLKVKPGQRVMLNEVLAEIG